MFRRYTKLNRITSKELHGVISRLEISILSGSSAILDSQRSTFYEEDKGIFSFHIANNAKFYNLIKMNCLNR